MTEWKMCAYCGKWYSLALLKPLHEQGKDYVNWYCERCKPAVKSNLLKLPYSSLFKGEIKGQDK
ncbi:hypothetical protein [Peribacillus simplex]|uniref:hypothetical protein n=1 Tax=Peribacillus simplex TaxID=1478 RepID=UPI0024C193A8|nr:hypothetical protein [Peribacillus simplex]WHY58376.1 hypothetical protein QNH43_08990 [Peribacillus simplex]